MTESSSGSGKGRPTPRRKDAEARRVRRSLAPAATKEAKQEQRETLRKMRAQQREAYLRGDESALPVRDRGPAKRLARDMIDSRRSLAEYLMPLVFVVLLLSVMGPQVQVVASILMYIVMIAAIVDTTLLARRIRRAVSGRIPDASTKGLTSYTILRASQIRRLRIPRPKVERGAKI